MPGDTVGQLTITRSYLTENPNGRGTGRQRRDVDCVCSCGNRVTVPARELRWRRTCGCRISNEKHGLTKTRLGLKAYEAARNAFRRCRDEACEKFHYYGGRGIDCAFDNYIEMARYLLTLPGIDAPGVTLDRIDNDGHYEVDNLRWVSRSVQNSNRRARAA